MTVTVLTAGMSGCHLLCRGFSCSHGLLLISTEIRGVGVLGGMLPGQGLAAGKVKQEPRGPCAVGWACEHVMDDQAHCNHRRYKVTYGQRSCLPAGCVGRGMCVDALEGSSERH